MAMRKSPTRYFMIRLISILLLLVLTSLTSSAAVAKTEKLVPLVERAPAYFVDRYGPAKTSKNVTQANFIHPTRGNIVLKGQFSTREFQSGDLRVQTVFLLPSLKLAAVTLRFPRAWTPERIDAALTAYASDWKPDGPQVVVKTWTTPRGDKAVFTLSALEIQSASIAQRVEAAVQESDAKRKAIPKF